MTDPDPNPGGQQTYGTGSGSTVTALGDCFLLTFSVCVIGVPVCVCVRCTLGLQDDWWIDIRIPSFEVVGLGGGGRG
jgi:hypothetical protein